MAYAIRNLKVFSVGWTGTTAISGDCFARRTSTRGSTALYDAVVAAAAHLQNETRLDKKNSSGDHRQRGQHEPEDAVRGGAVSGTEKQSHPLCRWTHGTRTPERDREALQELDATGGSAFFPQSMEEVNDVAGTLAHDIRSQYTIAYKPQNQNASAPYHPIVVEAHATGYGRLSVRTRNGYYAGESVR